MITSIISYIWRQNIKQCPDDEQVLFVAGVLHLICLLIGLATDIAILIRLF